MGATVSAHGAESDARFEADLLIEVGHPSRPDRQELMRQHIARIKALAWDEGYLAAGKQLFGRWHPPAPECRGNPYRAQAERGES